jgi:membrane-associated phospholipid phosphatase
MEDTLDWGVTIILWFQQFSPTLDMPFKLFTFMGEKASFMLLVLLLYWCIDRRTGVRLAILFLFSGYVNTVAKVLADQPRPFQYDTQVHKLFEASGGGLPSGHTQNTVVIWGYMASQAQNVWLWIIAILLMLLTPLSRVYLGVHFPTDLIGGYLLGISLLLLYCWLEPHAEAWLEKKGLCVQLAVALAIPALISLLFPSNEENGIIAGATLMGMGAGFVLESRWVGFSSGGIWWKQVVRFLLGTAILFALWSGLKAAFSGLEPEPLFRFVRYVLVGLWGGLGAPAAFVTLQLAQTQQPGDTA